MADKYPIAFSSRILEWTKDFSQGWAVLTFEFICLR